MCYQHTLFIPSLISFWNNTLNCSRSFKTVFVVYLKCLWFTVLAFSKCTNFLNIGTKNALLLWNVTKTNNCKWHWLDLVDATQKRRFLYFCLKIINFDELSKFWYRYWATRITSSAEFWLFERSYVGSQLVFCVSWIGVDYFKVFKQFRDGLLFWGQRVNFCHGVAY